MSSRNLTSRVRSHRALRFLLFAVLLPPSAFCLLPSSRAQTIQLRDGTTVPTLGIRREGDTLIAKVKITGDNVGELGYPLANVLRVDFPEPALLKTAPEMIDKGQTDEALRQLAPAVAYYAPFYNVPGTYWKPLAVLQLDALTAAHRDKEADTAAADLARFVGNDPEVSRLLKTRQAEALLRQGDAKKALDLLTPLARDETAPPSELAPVWIDQGAAWLGLRDYKAALLAYLRVPVYTPERTRLMPAALLGSARAYLGLDDKPRAEDALNRLLSTYPSAAEAADAQQQLLRINRGPSATPSGS